MDSRHWQRRLMPLEVEVRLWRRSGEQVITCQTRDVSMSGAFLSTEELGYPKHRLLDIRFTALDRLGLKQPRIFARAIRKENGGLAIRFRKADRDTIRAMHKMLQWRKYFPISTQTTNPSLPTTHGQRRYLRSIQINSIRQ